MSTKLDMEQFKKKVAVTTLTVPNNKIREVQRKLSEFMITLPKFKPCQHIEGDNTRKKLVFKRIDEGNEKLKEVLDANESIEKSEGEIEIGYENLNMVEALRVIIFSQQDKVLDPSLPRLTAKDIPSGFETVGDVAHMNFNQSQYPFRYQIGQVVKDKNHNIRTVVCKIGQIKSEYRYYDLECIAGESGPGSFETI